LSEFGRLVVEVLWSGTKMEQEENAAERPREVVQEREIPNPDLQVSDQLP
jgi:hypothetical protein